MTVEADFSMLSRIVFWKEMRARQFVHPYDENGRRITPGGIPSSLTHLEDDPYRSLAGFVRINGGFAKTTAPFVEFLWADYFRARVKAKMLKKHFDKALKSAMALARHKDAGNLPGYIKKP